MRRKVILDPDVEQLVRERMRDRMESFEQALNELIRAGAVGEAEPAPFRTETASLGLPLLSLDRALQAAGELEDE